VVILFLEADAAATFVKGIRQAPEIDIGGQKVSISYVPTGKHNMAMNLYKGIAEKGWSRVIVIAVPNALVLVDNRYHHAPLPKVVSWNESGAALPASHMPFVNVELRKIFRNQQYLNLFSDQEANSIAELQHLDADNKEIVKIYRSTERAGEKTHFLVHIEFASVIAAVGSVYKMQKSQYLRGCKMRFAADPCGGITCDGIKYDVGNIQNSSPISHPVPPPRSPSPPSYPVRPTMYAEFNPLPQ
jgi:hypothetical protein